MPEDNIPEPNTNETISGEELPDAGKTASISTDEQNSSKNTSVQPADTIAAKERIHIQTPVIIASVILLAAILFFACWSIFFNKSLKGSWTLNFTASDKDCAVTMSFENDGTCYLQSGGTIYKGSYTTNSADNGRSKLSASYTSFGQPFINSNFYYDLSGNSITGRRLHLTDLSGMVFRPDDLSDDGSTSKKDAADYIEENGKRYYIYTLNYSDSYETKYTPLDGATDEKLIGIWFERSSDSNYDNTFAFNADGTYQITYRDIIYKGCYAAKDGTCVFNLVQADGSAINNSLDYSFDGDELVITINDVTARLVRTKNIYAFGNGIK